MIQKNSDLHGAAPYKCTVVVLIIDLINEFDFDSGDELLK